CQAPLERLADYSSMWITSGLPTIHALSCHPFKNTTGYAQTWANCHPEHRGHRCTRTGGLAVRGRSGAVLGAAFDWLCKRRVDYADSADVWNVRFRWPEIKPQL